MTDELAHYGVKGMRWGVRKLDDDQLVLRKGTTIHRVSTTPDERNEGHAYASFTDADIKTYQTIMKTLGRKNKSFDLTMTLKKDLISPSQKTRVNTFLKLMDTPEFAKEMDRVQKRLFVMKLGDRGTSKLVRDNPEMDKKKARAYVVLNLVIAGNPKLRNQYFGELSKLGYNMVIDEADRANGVSKSPIIVFDRRGILDITGVTKLK